ncbi:uncharacterized protein F5Z01DRAFT_266895 [Emericellopsis atlantica]|uniref:Uncharacterized protein n=1 Tax=Emericellopsis atlantica TaxID=2614577 RepID=A0A9P8CNJ4_9HYPO|nr:uncharacterized protein F5Z01DRAFT_266895 [Emericellopsis atlantica]KAG9251791.1 hypothetical protein F5Z01DRAFT_266895 [Emericellopsis atlantica]
MSQASLKREHSPDTDSDTEESQNKRHATVFECMRQQRQHSTSATQQLRLPAVKCPDDLSRASLADCFRILSKAMDSSSHREPGTTSPSAEARSPSGRLMDEFLEVLFGDSWTSADPIVVVEKKKPNSAFLEHGRVVIAEGSDNNHRVVNCTLLVCMSPLSLIWGFRNHDMTQILAPSEVTYYLDKRVGAAADLNFQQRRMLLQAKETICEYIDAENFRRAVAFARNAICQREQRGTSAFHYVEDVWRFSQSADILSMLRNHYRQVCDANGRLCFFSGAFTIGRARHRVEQSFSMMALSMIERTPLLLQESDALCWIKSSERRNEN